MSDPAAPSQLRDEVAVHLLDPASGRPVQSWTFRGQSSIRIGRQPDQDVEISDPYVSRHHARLELRRGQWWLVSLGRHGVVVANQLIGELPVVDDVSFRLGAEGPLVRFQSLAEENDESATMTFEAPAVAEFRLDQRQLEREVGEITTGVYFQQLQERSRQMRRRRQAE